jgi:hypothetical protein
LLRPLKLAGLVTAPKAAPSRLPCSDPPDSAGAIEIVCVAEFVGLAVGLVRASVGAAGAIVSTVQLRVVAGPVVATAFFARTAKLWPPSARLVNAAGLVPAANDAPSRLVSNVTPLSLELNVKLALDELVAPLGPESIDGAAGTVVFTVQEIEAAEPVFPAASI